MKKKKSLILVVILLIVLAAFSITYGSTTNTMAKEDELAALLKKVGSYEKENKELRMLQGKEVIALVNGDIPIYKNEVEYRKGLKEIAYGNRENEFLNSFTEIVRKKILLDFAEKNNIYVSDEEIFDFIKREKEDEDLNKYVKIFCENAGMTLEEYWNEYEYEKVKLLLTLKKLEDFIIEQGIQKGEIPKMSDKYDENIYQKHIKYVKDFKNNLMERANIQINQNYKEKLNGFNNEKLFK